MHLLVEQVIILSIKEIYEPKFFLILKTNYSELVKVKKIVIIINYYLSRLKTFYLFWDFRLD